MVVVRSFTSACLFVTALVVSVLFLIGPGAPDASATLPETPGQQKVAVILVNFSDDRYSDTTTASTMRERFFTAPNSVSAHLKASTYDTLWLGGILEPEGDVFDWTELDSSIQSCDQTFVTNDAKAAIEAANPGLDADAYDYIVLISTPNSPCGVNGGYQEDRMFAKPSVNAFDATHEFGHMIASAGHADSRRCNVGDQIVAIDPNGTCRKSDYGDELDVMGTNLYLFNGLQRARLGAIPTSAIVNVTSPGDYELRPINDTPAEGLTQLLRIHRQGNEHFVIDFRRDQPGPWDANSLDPLSTGPIIRSVEVDSGIVGSPLQPGEVIRPTPNSQTHDFEKGSIGDTSTWGSRADRLAGARSKKSFLRPGRTFYDPVSDASITTLAASPSSTSIRYEEGSPGATSIVSVDSGVLTFSAGAGKSNDVGISLDGAELAVVDNGGSLGAGAGCSASTFSKVTCEAALVSSISMDLGDRDDGAEVYSDIPAVINGGTGNDVIVGSNADDRILGGQGDDLINPRGGSNSIDYSDHEQPVVATLTRAGEVGGSANELDQIAETPETTVNELIGGNGADQLTNICDGGDSLTGGGGADSIDGGACAEQISGGGGGDTLSGGGGADMLSGDAGDDLLQSRGLEADSVQCGDGNDSSVADKYDTGFSGCESVDQASDTQVSAALGVVLVDAAAGTRNQITVTEAAGQFVVKDANHPVIPGLGCSLVDEQTATCSSLNVMSVDVTTGDLNDNVSVKTDASATVDGGDGNDYLSTSGGADSILGGDGDDEIRSGRGVDSVVAGTGDDLLITRDTFSDAVDCGLGTDNLLTDELDTSLMNCESPNTLSRTMVSPPEIGLRVIGAQPESSNELVLTDLGSQIRISDTGAGVYLLDTDCQQESWTAVVCPDTDRPVVRAQDLDDSIVSDLTDPGTYDGGAGDDVLSTGAGDDLIIGDIGDDQISAGGGENEASGGAGNDEISQGGAAASDLVNGGPDFDTVSYELRTASVNVNLDTLESVNGELEEADSLISVEQVIGGSANDTMSTSHNQDNVLVGGDGDDILREPAESLGRATLRGENGADEITAHTGADNVSGGVGDDTINTRGVPDGGDLDSVTCEGGVDTVTADESDSIAPDCELVDQVTMTTLRIEDRVLRVTAADTLANQIRVLNHSQTAAIGITDTSVIDPDSACTAFTQNDVRCPRSEIDSIVLEAGDGDDSININVGVNLPFTADGGPGSDQLKSESNVPGSLVGGEGADTITASVNSRIDILAGDGDDSVFARNALSDSIDCGSGDDTAEIDTLEFETTANQCESISEERRTRVAYLGGSDQLRVDTAGGLSNDITIATSSGDKVLVTDQLRTLNPISCQSLSTNSAECDMPVFVQAYLSPGLFAPDGVNSFESNLPVAHGVQGSPNADHVQLGGGNDQVSSGYGDDVIDTGTGDDQLIDYGGTNDINPGPGEDNLYVSGGGNTDLVDGERDVMVCAGSTPVLAETIDDLTDCTDVTIESVAPQTTITQEAGSPTTDPSGAWAFASSEFNSSFECKFEPGSVPGSAEFGACSGPGATHSVEDLDSGSFVFSVRARDVSGNVDETPATAMLVVATEPPVVAITAPANGAVVSSITPGYNVTDGMAPYAVTCQLDGGTPRDCNSLTEDPAHVQGVHTLTVTAVDFYGNSGTSSVNFTYDPNPPQLNVTAPVGTLTNNQPTVHFTTSSFGGLQWTLCVFDDDWNNWTFCADGIQWPSSLADGPHNVLVRSLGNNGLVSTRVSEFVVDTTAPNSTITTGPAEGSIVTTTSVVFGYSGAPAADTASFQCRIDTGAWFGCGSGATGSYTTPTLSYGAHSFAVRAIDAFGNEDESPDVRNFTVSRPGMITAGTKSTVSSSTTVNLTTNGPAGWAHWGTTSSSSEATLLTPTRKSGTTSSLISNAVRLGSVTTTRVTSGIPTASWTGGTPSGSPTRTAIQTGANATTPGFEVTIAAPPTANRTARLYIGALRTTAKVMVSIDDGSATTYTDTAAVTGGTSASTVMLPITFRGVQPNARVTVRVTQNVANSLGRVYLHSIALTDVAP